MPDDPGESSVIAAILRERPSPRGVLVDIGDDGAALQDGTVLTTDLMVEGVHFDDKLSPADIGWKVVAVNVSDLGAMGARPRWALLGLSLPRPLDMAWVRSFSEGLGAALTHWELDLLGGDTTASPGPRVVSLTVGGEARQAVTRSGALPGDDLWVTGTLGAAAAGFRRDGPGRDWLRRPDPPVSFGIALAEAGLVDAMMDLSDGMATDLPRLCEASGVGATVDTSTLPLHEGTLDAVDPLQDALAWGEDYQLLFTAPGAHRAAIQTCARLHQVRVTRIGRMDERLGCRLSSGPWPQAAFTHFGQAS